MSNFNQIKQIIDENKINTQELYYWVECNDDFNELEKLNEFKMQTVKHTRTGSDYDEIVVVIEFTNKNTDVKTYIKIFANYHSHYGVSFDDNYMIEVFPKEKTIIIYE